MTEGLLKNQSYPNMGTKKATKYVEEAKALHIEPNNTYRKCK
jgi:hypothetical protein